MVDFESQHPPYPGSIELPDYYDFTDTMFDAYKTALEQRKSVVTDKNEIYRFDLNRLAAFSCLDIIKNHGEWNIKNLSINDFAAWEKEGGSSKFIAWVGSSFRQYFEQAASPNALPSKSNDG